MDGTHDTFCRFCIAGCGLRVTVRDNAVAGVSGLATHPLSHGYTCEKGRAVGVVEHHAGRLTEPVLRRGGRAETADPDGAVADLAARLAAVVQTHGADAVAVYQGNGAGHDSTAWSACGWFARAVGTSNRYTSLTLDAIAKPYVIDLMFGDPGLVAHPGADPAVVLVVGSNPIVSHGHTTAFADPVRRLRQWAKKSELWVLDPRRTETAEFARHHVACLPGSDHVFLAAVLRRLLDSGRWSPPAGASGMAGLRACVDDVDDAAVASQCGVDLGLATALAHDIVRAGRVAVVSGTGSTMSEWGNLVEWLLMSIAVVTGSLEVPGGTWFHPGFFRPARPSGNVQRGAVDGAARRFGQRPCVELVERIESGSVRALVVVGGNPLRSFPDTTRTFAALRTLDVLAVVDVAGSELTDLATHVLPAPTQLERPDVNVVSELAQPVAIGQYTPALRRRAAGVRSVWWWLAAVGDRLGHVVLPAPLGLHSSDEEVLDLVAGPRRALLPRGAAGTTTHAWKPWITTAPGGWSCDLAPAPLVEQWRAAMSVPAADSRLRLLPCRERRHLNATFMAEAAAVATMHPDDAAAIAVADGDTVEVVAASSARLRLVVDDRVRQGTVSVPHGFAGDADVNLLTTAEQHDPATGMPVLTALAVEVRAVGR